MCFEVLEKAVGMQASLVDRKVEYKLYHNKCGRGLSLWILEKLQSLFSWILVCAAVQIHRPIELSCLHFLSFLRRGREAVSFFTEL